MIISSCLYLNFIFYVEVHLFLENFNETNTWNKYKYKTLGITRNILDFYEKMWGRYYCFKKEWIVIILSYFLKSNINYSAVVWNNNHQAVEFYVQLLSFKEMFWWHEAFCIEGKKNKNYVYNISLGEVFWFYFPVLR